ncbi:methyltransferase regulatory domain-containing protein [Candidatus Magnetaquicoccus inordinatus]|uniref:methyltransferase regulatory domain-containing protein n=1 Tax=Candidatus Magnetaquicoccus inordinatus TaxID=2496818 RepID=UPI00102D208F|nr:class I SAM-dependent methyltransferase [Candidatus Magnetaquicoccus inordinatus]
MDRATPYDKVPYTNNAHPQTHIANLYTLGRIFGLTPPPFQRCRVLELGCGRGGNLLPMAWEYPESQFLGIDLSQVQIDDAQHSAEALQLRNLHFCKQSIEEFANNHGAFDYIICHGVYSWVPEEVQEGILRILRDHLSSDGIAVVSYNTLPGWYFVRALRDMMVYQEAIFPEASDRSGQARLLLTFLKEHAQDQNMREFAAREVQILTDRPDNYLLHDHLGDDNRPCYFSEFVSRAINHGLQYLGDTMVKTMFVHNFSPEVAERLSVLHNQIQQEQFLDFIANRRFRSTLLCRSGVTIKNSLEEIVRSFAIRFFMTPQQEDLTEGEPLPTERSFVSADGALLTVSDPLTIALFDTLAKQNDKPLFVSELVQKIRWRFGIGDAEGIHHILLNDGIRLFTAGLLTFHADAGCYTTEISAHPQALPLSRYQAQQSNRVVNGRHQMVALSAEEATLLQILDGETSWHTILQRFRQQQEKQETDQENDNTEKIWLERLHHLAREALLLR